MIGDRGGCYLIIQGLCGVSQPTARTAGRPVSNVTGCVIGSGRSLLDAHWSGDCRGFLRIIFGSDMIQLISGFRR